MMINSLKSKIFMGTGYLLFVFIFLEIFAGFVLNEDYFIDKLQSDYVFTKEFIWAARDASENGAEVYSGQTYYSFDSHLGWKLKPNLKNMEMYSGYGKKILNTNSQGIRGHSEYDFSMPSSKTRILTIGDSFTFGDEVNDSETYPFYVQQMLTGSEVINMGVSGYGHDQMLIQLKEVGIQYKPNIVIIGFLEYAFRNMTTFTDYAKPMFELMDNRLRLVNSPVPPPGEICSRYIHTLKFPLLLKLLYLRVKGYPYDELKKIDDLTAAILDEMLITIKAAQAIPLFIYIPPPSDIGPLSKHDAESAKDSLNRWEIFLATYCKEREIPYLSLTPKFIDSIKKGVDYPNEGHWNPEGNHAIASGIKGFLTKHNLISAKAGKISY